MLLYTIQTFCLEPLSFACFREKVKEGSLLQDLSTGVVGITGKVGKSNPTDF